MTDKFPMTKDGLKVKDELEHLKITERPDVIKAISEAKNMAICQKMPSTTQLEKNKALLREESQNSKIKF